MMGDGEAEVNPMLMFSDPEGRQAFGDALDNEVRLKALDAQGVAAEIAITNFDTPFRAMPGAATDLSLLHSGYQAYNRWLADTLDPVRQGGLVLIGYEDVDLAVAEIKKGAAAGMRGVYLDGQVRGLP